MISPEQKTLSKQAIQEYKRVKSWDQLRQWHRKNTPSVTDQVFRMMMKQYCGEARKHQKQGALSPNHKFMTSEVFQQPQDQQQSEQIVLESPMKAPKTQE